MDIINAAFITALILGIATISLTLWKYFIKSKHLGKDGIFILVIGLILMTLSFTKDLTLTAFGINLIISKQEVDSLKSDNQNLSVKLNTIDSSYTNLKENIKNITELNKNPGNTKETAKEKEKRSENLTKAIDSLKTKSTKIDNTIKEVKKDNYNITKKVDVILKNTKPDDKEKK
jgi:hypothetical protein